MDRVFSEDDAKTEIKMPVDMARRKNQLCEKVRVQDDAPMEYPRTRVIGEESNRGIASNVADADNIAHDRVDVVVFGMNASALDNAKGVLYDQMNQFKSYIDHRDQDLRRANGMDGDFQ